MIDVYREAESRFPDAFGGPEVISFVDGARWAADQIADELRMIKCRDAAKVGPNQCAYCDALNLATLRVEELI